MIIVIIQFPSSIVLKYVSVVPSCADGWLVSVVRTAVDRWRCTVSISTARRRADLRETPGNYSRRGIAAEIGCA